MFMFAGSLKDLLPIIEKITRGPGRSLVVYSGLLNAFALVTGVLLARSGSTFAGPLTACVGAIGLFFVVLFGIRRERLQAAVEKWRSTRTLDAPSEAVRTDYARHYGSGTPSSSKEIIVIEEDGTYRGSERSYIPDDAEAIFRDRQREAVRASSERRNTWMPRVEAAQRSAIAAAGGLAQAPYLRDDLRVTIISVVFSVISMPLSAFFGFFALIGLL